MILLVVITDSRSLLMREPGNEVNCEQLGHTVPRLLKMLVSTSGDFKGGPGGACAPPVSLSLSSNSHDCITRSTVLIDVLYTWHRALPWYH